MHIESKHGSKLFKCDKCDYVSRRDEYLKKHVRDHHGNYMFNCGLCDYSWHSKVQLQNHVKTIHSNTLIRNFDVAFPDLTGWANARKLNVKN